MSSPMPSPLAVDTVLVPVLAINVALILPRTSPMTVISGVCVAPAARRFGTVKCVRCIERDNDYSFGRGKRTADIDIHLPDILDSVEESLGQVQVEQQAAREPVDGLFKLVRRVRHEQRRLRVDLILALGLDKKLLNESDLLLSDAPFTDEEADEEEHASPGLGGESGRGSVGDERHDEQAGDDEQDDRAGEVKPKRPKKKVKDEGEYVPSSAKGGSSTQAPSKKGKRPAALANTAQDDTSGEETETEHLIPKSKKEVKSVFPPKSASRASESPVASSSRVTLSRKRSSAQGESGEPSESKCKRAKLDEERLGTFTRAREERLMKAEKVVVKKERK
ncbi:hypothetical protein LXA43DRAFT_1097223 [Ganoderma leucocontextum]|nr:hypothetical protein LXA43DRAFT_1097223 [Ganoderma leucocontextum]